MQLQLVSADEYLMPSSHLKLRPMRDFETLSSTNAPQRAELLRQRNSVAFDQQTIHLRHAFRTAPEPVTVELPSRNSSILRTRSPSTAIGFVPAIVESQLPWPRGDQNESNRHKELLKKKKKKVSFVQTEPEHEVEHASVSGSNRDEEPCSCQGSRPTQGLKNMPSPIHASCRRAELQALKHLLSFYFGADLIKLVNSSCACGRTPLEVACETGSTKMVKLLLKRHADPNGTGSGSHVAGAPRVTTLSSHICHHRRRSGDPVVVLKPDRQQRTCFGIACKNRKVEILELLMRYGARIDEDALVTAASLGHEDVVRTLVTFANVNAKKRASPVHHLFYKKGAEANERTHVPLISSSSLQKACSAAAVAHAELVCILLGSGKDVASRATIVKCAFDAVRVPDYRLLKCLAKTYDARLLLDAREKSSQSSLLHLAVKNGSAKAVRLLVKMGADVHAQDGSGIAPLYLACARGQEAVVQTLLGRGAKCTAVGPSGETALHIAAQENQLACVKLLLEVGNVPVDDVTHDGCTALHLASQRGNTAVAACLLDHGANVDAVTVGNESPLLKASRMGQLKTVELLLSRNASVQPAVLTSKTSEQQLTVASSPPFESLSSDLAGPGAQLSRRRSWSSSGHDSHRNNSKRRERIFVTKSSPHTSLKHWFRSMLNN